MQMLSIQLISQMNGVLLKNLRGLIKYGGKVLTFVMLRAKCKVDYLKFIESQILYIQFYITSEPFFTQQMKTQKRI